VNTEKEEETNCADIGNNTGSCKNNKRLAFSRTTTNTSYTSRLARLPPRIGGFDAIVNESKEKEKTRAEKAPTIGTVNTDREENLKEIGVVSSSDEEEEEGDEDDDDEDDDDDDDKEESA
jgi:hypothetical protein